MDKLRGEFDRNKIGHIVFNIVEIINNSRGELSGCNLSNLNLKNINFLDIVLSRWYNNNLLSVNLQNSDIENFINAGHHGSIESCYYNKNEEKLLSASCDNAVIEWNIISKKIIKKYRGLSGKTKKAIYNEDESKILGYSNEGGIYEWDVVNKKLINIYSESSYGKNLFKIGGLDIVYYNKNETHVISIWKNKSIVIFDTNTGDVLKKYHLSKLIDECVTVDFVLISKDEEKIIYFFRNSNDVAKILIYDTKKENIKEYEHSYNNVELALLNKDESKIIFVNERYCEDGTKYDIIEFDLNREIFKYYYTHDQSISKIIYNIDETKIISSSYDYLIKEYIIENNIVKNYQHNNFVDDFCYNRNESKILSCDASGRIYEWNTQNQKQKIYYINQDEWIRSVKYSKNEQNILFFSNTNRIIQMALYNMRENIYNGNTGYINSCHLNRNKNKCLINFIWSSNIIEYNIENNRIEKNFFVHKGFVKGMIYNQDETKILLFTSIGEIKEYDLKTGELLFNYEDFNEISMIEYIENETKILVTIFGERNSCAIIKEIKIDTKKAIEKVRLEDVINYMTYSSDKTKIICITGSLSVIVIDLNSNTNSNYILSKTDESIFILNKTEACIEFKKQKNILCKFSILKNNFEEFYKASPFNTSCYITTNSEETLLFSNGEISKKNFIHNKENKYYKIKDIKFKRIKFNNDASKILGITSNGELYEYNLIKDILIYYSQYIQFSDAIYNFNETKILGISQEGKLIIFNELGVEKTIEFYTGLNIKGCNFNNLHPNSNFSEKDKEIMKQYGAIFD